MLAVIITALISVGLIVIVASYLVLSPSQFPAIEHERVRTVANIVAAGAAATIPIVVFQAADLSRASEISTARNTQTLEMMNALDHRLLGLLKEKRRLDRIANMEGEFRFEFEYISQAELVTTVVREILNEYEAICVGVSQGMLSYSIVWAMRGDALIATFENYRAYIRQLRTKRENANVWSDCVDLAKELHIRRESLNREAHKTAKRQMKLLPPP